MRFRITVCLTILGIILVVAALYLTIQINSPAGRLARARTLCESDRLEALQQVRAAIQLSNGDFPEAQLFETQLLTEVRRFQEAESRFDLIKHAERLDPVTVCQLAEQAEVKGRWNFAARIYALIPDYVFADPVVFKRYIQTVDKSSAADGNVHTVLELCDKYAHRWPDDVFPWWLSSKIYSEYHAPALACQALREALKRQSSPEDQLRFRLALANSSLQVGDLQTAREQCDRLIRTGLDGPLRESISILNANLVLREGNPQRALDMLNLFPRDASLLQAFHALRGRCFFEVGDLTKAVEELRTAVEQNDLDQQSHYLLGQAYLKMDQTSLAEPHLRRNQELNELTTQLLMLKHQLNDDPDNPELKQKFSQLLRTGRQQADSPSTHPTNR